jgi:glycosyltransferase involved in cell wall biosynthesis
MKIGIDARFLTHPQPGGFKTYTHNLIAALAEIDTVNEYILYTDRPLEHALPFTNAPNMQVCIVAGTLPMVGMPWREQFGLSRYARRDQLDLLHSPCLTAPLRLECPSVVTIHDTIWLDAKPTMRCGKLFSKRALMRWYYRSIPRHATQRAAAIITVSNASKQAIIQRLQVPAARVFVTYEAAGHLFQPVDEPARIVAVRQRYGVPSTFILAIGSADPRKNLAMLLQAYARLPAQVQMQYALAIVWTHNALAPELAAQAEALGIRQRLHFLQRVPDEDLAVLYSAATTFVFPSLYEGFGLPLLEAMRCGTTVVSANNSSLPEIAGDAAVLVDAEDSQALANAIARVLGEPALRKILIQRGHDRAASFSWAACAQHTVRIYQQVCAGHTRPHKNDIAQLAAK